MTVADLVADPANRRKRTDRNRAMLRDSLRTVGAARSIAIDEGNVVLAGNGVVEAAAAEGITKVRVVDAAGDEIIAVRRTGLSDDQKRQLAMYDNRTAELAEWDTEQLRVDAAAGLDLKPFWSEAELASLLPAATIAAPDPREAPPVTVGQCAVIVLCADEADQKRTYEALAAGGYSCKVVNT